MRYPTWDEILTDLSRQDWPGRPSPRERVTWGIEELFGTSVPEELLDAVEDWLAEIAGRHRRPEARREATPVTSVTSTTSPPARGATPQILCVP